MTAKAFTTFSKGGKRFIAIPNDSQSVAVLSELGENYGSYGSVESFLEHYPTGKDWDATCLGRVRLSARALPEGAS